MGSKMEYDLLVDAKGLYCPIPILRLAKAFRGQPEGTVALLLATDPAAVSDVEAFCREGRHTLLGWRNKAGVLSFLVRKSGTPAAGA